jgi:amino acid adenylation domain-containing protein
MNSLIHESMIAFAGRCGESVAVQTESRTLLYRELEKGSATLAACLGALERKQEARIGLFMDKRIEAVIAIYGILRAGCAYVPMDIDNPVPRIHHLLEDSHISTLITTIDWVDVLADRLAGNGRQLTLIVLTDDQHISVPDKYHFRCIAVAPLKDRPQCGGLPPETIRPQAENLATVLYTSGSTGLPKGVMLTHACVATFTKWAASSFQLTSTDRFASHAPLHFDLSFFDLFAAHQVGARVVLIPGRMAGNPKALAHLIAKQRITIWQSVPSALVLLEKYGDLSRYACDCLRHVLFAGERMPVQSLQRLSRHFPKADFHNIYGATETNDTFIFSMSSRTTVYPDPLPIGKPLPYVAYRIVDEKLEAVPPGCEGELLVHTPTMMRGYINGDDEAVVDLKPHMKSPLRKRYYRTKDMAKLLPDGNLYYLGRKDDIVKSNGYRINLLEIECVLHTHQGLQDIAVIALTDEEIGNRIVAVVTPHPVNRVTGLELKVYCAERLARYAIPHRFVIRSSPLPRTASGKIDKKRVLDPVFEFNRPSITQDSAALSMKRENTR